MAGLYLHIPFCKQRCVYCDFYFVTGRRDHGPFVKALCRELRSAAQHRPALPLHTVYLGGGTPSLLSCYDLDTILHTVHDTYDTSNLAEVTLEANPDDISASYLRELCVLGINRVSLGTQSFFDDELRFMHRSHDAQTAKRTMSLVADSELASYSADVIFGLPGQTTDRWTANVSQLLTYAPPHVSTYSLTIEPGTPLRKNIWRGLVHPAENDTVAQMYQITMDMLRSSGMEHYEISNFCRSGHRAQHNRHYWTHANYIGVGPSAHSFWWDRKSAAQRWSNVRNLAKYLSFIDRGEDIVVLRETLDLSALGTERIMLGLRTAEGIDTTVLKRDYAVDLITESNHAIASMVAGGLLVCTDGHVRLTDRGKHVCDSITARLLPTP